MDCNLEACVDTPVTGWGQGGAAAPEACLRREWRFILYVKVAVENQMPCT